MNCESTIEATRAVDLGLYPIPITYKKYPYYSSKTSQLCSATIIVMFLIYIIAAEIIPWRDERNFSLTSSERRLNGVDISDIHADLIAFLNFTVQTYEPMKLYAKSIPSAIIENGVRCNIQAKGDYGFFLDDCIGNCTGHSTTYFDGFSLRDSEAQFEEDFVQNVYVHVSPCKIVESSFSFVHRTFTHFSIYFEVLGDPLTAAVFGRIEHSNADISTELIEGFVMNRKSDHFDMAGVGSFVLDMTFQKVRIRHHSNWYSDTIVKEEIVYTQPNPGAGTIMSLGTVILNIDIVIRLSQDEIIVEVRPETFSQMVARIGGLSTLLVSIGLLLRFYNATKFFNQQEVLDFERLSQAIKFFESAEKEKEENLGILSKECRIVEPCDKPEVEMGELKRKLCMHINEDEPMDLLDLLLIKQTAQTNMVFNFKYNTSGQTERENYWEEVLAFANTGLEMMGQDIQPQN